MDCWFNLRKGNKMKIGKLYISLLVVVGLLFSSSLFADEKSEVPATAIVALEGTLTDYQLQTLIEVGVIPFFVPDEMEDDDVDVRSEDRLGRLLLALAKFGSTLEKVEDLTDDRDDPTVEELEPEAKETDDDSGNPTTTSDDSDDDSEDDTDDSDDDDSEDDDTE